MSNGINGVDFYTPQHDEMQIKWTKFKNVRILCKKDYEEFKKNNQKYKFFKKPKNKSELISVNIEVPVVKGEGEYKTDIGYWDIVVKYRFLCERFGEYEESDEEVVRLDNNFKSSYKTRTIGIELKPNLQSIGGVIRQIKRYSIYYPVDKMFIITNIITDPKITKKDVKELCNRECITILGL